MNYQYFLEQLLNLYENWGQDSVYPKSAQFQAAIEQVNEMTTANVMQLLNFAVDCMEPGEIYCEIGCFQGATLIGALLNHSEQLAYAVDNFSRFDENGENLEKLIDNLTKFGIEEQVIFCEQDFEEFFRELREINFEEKIGVFFYNKAHDYRSQLMALLLVKPFLANHALIVVSHSHEEAVHQANWDFIAAHPQCQMLLDLTSQESGDRRVWNSLQILSWDTDRNYIDTSTLKYVRKTGIIQSIYNLQFGSDRQILESIRQEAIELQKKQCYQAAEEKYKQFLRWDSRDIWIWYNLGILYYETERYRDALEALIHALNIDETHANLYYSVGLVYEKLNCYHEAAEAYKKAITIDSVYLDAYNNLGNLLYQDCQFEKAEVVYQKAIAAGLNHASIYTNLGNALIVQGKIDEAIQVYQQALDFEPSNSDILKNLKIARQYRKHPDRLYLSFGHHFYDRGQYSAAVIQYKKLLDISPNPQVYQKIFSSFISLKEFQKARDVLEEGIEHYPENKELQYAFIQMLIDCGQTQAALARSTSIRKTVDSLALKVQNALMLPILYQESSEIQVFRTRFTEELQILSQELPLNNTQEIEKALNAFNGQANFCLAYQGQNDLALQIQYGQILQRIMSICYPDWVKPLAMPSLTAEGKIRVGYISFNMGPRRLGELFIGWLRHCDRSQFEIYCYYLDRRVDDLTQQFKTYSDRFYQFSIGIEDVCQQIFSDRLHILVFPDIGLDAKITKLASLRLAPIQCTTWVHPVTSGLPTIDYFISSDLMEPEEAQDYYSEKLIRLPNIGISYARLLLSDPIKTRTDFGLQENRVIYLSCQSLFKYLPQYDYIFVEIAQQVPSSQIIFLSHPNPKITKLFRQRLEKAFLSVGLSSEQFCKILPRLDEEDYININQLSDVFLDTFSWSGGITTLKAIACHLPVVTCPGQFMRGRHSYAILRMLGISETIARNEVEYIDIAVRLGLDLTWRQDIVNRIANSQDRLYGDRECVSALEAFYQQAVRDYGLAVGEC